jgi:hypothetical protein
MASLVCKKCGKKKGLLGGMLEPWYSCPNCGIICNDCDSRGGFLGLGAKVCSECGEKLKPIK